MKNNKVTLVIFFLILSLGGVLRFNHILDLGPFMADTAWRLSETRFLIESLRWIKEKPRFIAIQEDLGGESPTDSFREFIIAKNLGEFVPTNAKSYLTFFTAFFYLAFRLPLEDAGNVMAATFGVLTILMAFVLGKTLYDAHTGLISSAVVAVSAYQIIYSGRGFELSPAIFFVMLSTYFYYRSRSLEENSISFLWLTGLSAGIAFGCHTSLSILPVILLLYEVHLFLSPDRLPLEKHVKRIGVLVISTLIPLLIAEIVYLYLRVLTNYPHFTYFEQLLFRFRQQGGWSRRLDADALILPRTLLILEGYVVTLLLLGGVVSILRRWLSDHRISLADLIIFTQFLLPLIWWSPHHNHIPRLLLLSLSTLPLVSARGGLALVGFMAARVGRVSLPQMITVFTLIVLVTGSYNSWELTNLKPGYKAAFEYMGSHEGDKHLSTLPYVSDVYYKGSFSPLIEGLAISNIKRLFTNGGYKYLLVDWQKYHLLKHTRYAWLYRVEKECKPVHEVSNSVGLYKPFLYENSYSPETLGQEMFNSMLQDQGMGLIKIYDLADVVKLP